MSASPRGYFARRKVDIDATLERYAADQELRTALRRLQNVDAFSDERLNRGALLAVMASWRVALVPLSQMCAEATLLARENAASTIMGDHLVR